MVTLAAETPYRWRIDRRGAMRVPGVMFASRRLLPDVAADQSLPQVVNVATLPGHRRRLVRHARRALGLQVSDQWGGRDRRHARRRGLPGGVGFDISCGVRLLVSPLRRQELEPSLPQRMDELDRCVPAA